MATEKPLQIISAPANADLSAKQYFFVKAVTGGKVDLCSAATDKPIGVLQNKPTANQIAEVVVSGITKFHAAGTTAVGNTIGTDANGKGAVYVEGTDTTKYGMGQALDAPAADNIGTMTIAGHLPHRLA